MNLYPFQEEAVSYHLAHRYSLNCSEMGTGKTIMALETARRTGLKTTVFGPAFLRATWEMEAQKLKVPITYVPYSMIHRADAAALSAGFWIADEVHYLKNPTAKRTHAFYSHLGDRLPEHFIGMTGTPIKNRVPDFWTLIGFCGLDPKGTSGFVIRGTPLGHYHAFSRYFCHVDVMKVGGRKVERYRDVRDERVPELKALLKGKFIRFLVKDVLKDLPEITRKEVKADIKATVDDAMLEAFLAYQKGHKADITAKARSAALKADFTAEYCQGLIEGGSGPLLIFTDHLESAARIRAHFPEAAMITGQTPMPQRQLEVARFQAGETAVIVATIGSLSVGVTLTAARHVVFNDLSWTPADNLQAEKRIHRIGQKDACVAHYIDATPTDLIIRKTLFSKLDSISRVLA